MHIDTLQTHVIDSLGSGVLNSVSGVPEGVDAVLLAGLRQHHPERDILMVLHDEERARRLAGALSFLGIGDCTRLFPAWDCLPYDRVSPHPAVAGVRLALLGDLCERSPGSGASCCAHHRTGNAAAGPATHDVAWPAQASSQGWQDGSGCAVSRSSRHGLLQDKRGHGTGRLCGTG